MATAVGYEGSNPSPRPLNTGENMNKKVNISVVDNVYCKTDKVGRKLIAPCLLYKKTYWKKKQYGKVESFYNVCMVYSNGYFLSGFLPRIKKYCRNNEITLEIKDTTYQKEHLPNKKSFLSFLEKTKKNLGEKFRKNQLDKQIELIESAIKEKRGILVSPTGTGKTTLALGIASYFPHYKILYVVHTKSLASQTTKEFLEYGFDVTTVMEGSKDQSGNIVVATRQSLIKMNLKKYNIIMVDEVHHISDEDDSYGIIIKNANCEMSFGFTATFKETKKQNQLAIEGLLGRVVGELTMEEAQEMQILAKPSIKIVKVPKQFLESRNYSDVYDEAVVYSRTRNRIICRMIKEYIQDNKKILIFVTKVEHGKEIEEMLKWLYGIKIPFIYGATPSEIREVTKHKLIEGRINAAIATVVWKEGINIPSLNIIINASGGKDDLPIMQLIGRGLRLTTGKTKMTLVDFFDESSVYLIKHFGNRISLYCEKGWI